MSGKAVARIVDMDEIDALAIELDLDAEGVVVESVMVGDPVSGTLYLVTHECPDCHSKMQTIGVAHGVYECSKCAAVRSRRKVMNRRFECLEIEE